MPAFTYNSANGLLKLLLWNQDFDLGNGSVLRGAVTPGSLYAAFFTADPGATGTAATNEVSTSGTNYGRIAIARNNTTWNITNNVANPAADIVFSELTGGSQTATWWGLVASASGSGILLLKGQLSPAITIAALKTPRITTASALTFGA